MALFLGHTMPCNDLVSFLLLPLLNISWLVCWQVEVLDGFSVARLGPALQRLKYYLL